MKAYLLLEDGHLFTGQSIGSPRETVCEVVFNTSMTGYIELLTDPSYAGQGVVMTYPMIGNYGFCFGDSESSRPWVSAFILRELARKDSNFRSCGLLESYLRRFDIPGIQGVDTRAITKLLRDQGTMRGLITTEQITDMDAALKKIRAYRHDRLVQKVTRTAIQHYEGKGKRVALFDFGAKENIIRCLTKRGCDVTVFPAETKAVELLGIRPDGIMLSNGPGDPKDCGPIIDEVRALLYSGVPTFAICLGHQLSALATGGDTEKLAYGHRGVNHPVRDLATGRSYITSQNHGYCVRAESIDPSVAEVAFENVNDGTVEGLRFKELPVFTVQFHPEASPGPKDTEFLFDRFIEMMGGNQ